MAKKRSVTADGSAILHARLLKGWEAFELAAKADLSVRTVEKAEANGEIDCKSLMLIAIALEEDWRNLEMNKGVIQSPLPGTLTFTLVMRKGITREEALEVLQGSLPEKLEYAGEIRISITEDASEH